MMHLKPWHTVSTKQVLVIVVIPVCATGTLVDRIMVSEMSKCESPEPLNVLGHMAKGGLRLQVESSVLMS